MRCGCRSWAAKSLERVPCCAWPALGWPAATAGRPRERSWSSGGPCEGRDGAGEAHGHRLLGALPPVYRSALAISRHRNASTSKRDVPGCPDENRGKALARHPVRAVKLVRRPCAATAHSWLRAVSICLTDAGPSANLASSTGPIGCYLSSKDRALRPSLVHRERPNRLATPLGGSAMWPMLPGGWDDCNRLWTSLPDIAPAFVGP